MAAGNKMAYVSVPKDLTRVKNKVVFNMTRRQIICFGTAGLIGIPFYIFSRNVIGNGNAMVGMVLLMIPAFLFAMYEKDGMPLEKVLMNMITVKYKRPQVRPYETVNLYEKPDTCLVSKSGKKRKKKGTAQGKGYVGEAGNFGRKMGVRSADEWREPDISRRNAEASVHAAAQKGGRTRARQG